MASVVKERVNVSWNLFLLIFSIIFIPVDIYFYLIPAVKDILGGRWDTSFSTIFWACSPFINLYVVVSSCYSLKSSVERLKEAREEAEKETYEHSMDEYLSTIDDETPAEAGDTPSTIDEVVSETAADTDFLTVLQELNKNSTETGNVDG